MRRSTSTATARRSRPSRRWSWSAALRTACPARLPGRLGDAGDRRGHLPQPLGGGRLLHRRGRGDARGLAGDRRRRRRHPRLRPRRREHDETFHAQCGGRPSRDPQPDRDPVCANAWAAGRARTCFRTTTLCMPAAGGGGAFFVMTANVFPGTTQTAPRIVMVLAGVSPGELGWRRAADAPLGAGSGPARCRRDAAFATPRGENAGAGAGGARWVRRFRLRAAPNLGGRHLDAFLWWCLCISSWLWRNRRAMT